MPGPCRRRATEQTGERICIVDDDEAVADSLKTLLETFAFGVDLYGSGSEFLADFEGGATGCLIIDHHMPGMSGLDVIDRLRREGIRLPTILISGRLDPATRKRAASLGVTEMVDKPFAAGRLVDLVRATLAGRS